MNMVLAYFHPPARDQATIVPFGVVQIINGTIWDLSDLAAMFRPFNLAEKWNGVERVRRSAGGDQLTANSDKLIAAPKNTVVSSFVRAILTIDAVQNQSSAIQGLIPPDTTFRARHLAEKVARSVARWPFSTAQNTNGHFSGLSHCITAFSPGHLAEKVAGQIRVMGSKWTGGPFSMIQNTNGPLSGLRPLGTIFRVARLVAQMCHYLSPFPECTSKGIPVHDEFGPCSLCGLRVQTR